MIDGGQKEGHATGGDFALINESNLVSTKEKGDTALRKGRYCPTYLDVVLVPGDDGLLAHSRGEDVVEVRRADAAVEDGAGEVFPGGVITLRGIIRRVGAKLHTHTRNE